MQIFNIVIQSVSDKTVLMALSIFTIYFGSALVYLDSADCSILISFLILGEAFNRLEARLIFREEQNGN